MTDSPGEERVQKLKISMTHSRGKSLVDTKYPVPIQMGTAVLGPEVEVHLAHYPVPGSSITGNIMVSLSLIVRTELTKRNKGTGGTTLPPNSSSPTAPTNLPPSSSTSGQPSTQQPDQSALIWSQLSKIRSLQSEISSLHIQMEGINLGGGGYGHNRSHRRNLSAVDLGVELEMMDEFGDLGPQGSGGDDANTLGGGRKGGLNTEGDMDVNFDRLNAKLLSREGDIDRIMKRVSPSSHRCQNRLRLNSWMHLAKR